MAEQCSELQNDWRKIARIHPSCTFVAAEMAEWKPSLPHLLKMPNNSINTFHIFHLFLNIPVVLIIGGKIRAVPLEAEEASVNHAGEKNTFTPALPIGSEVEFKLKTVLPCVACDTCGQQAHSHPDWQLMCILTTQQNLPRSCKALMNATEKLQRSRTRNLEHAYDRRVATAAGMIVLSYSGLRQTGEKHKYFDLKTKFLVVPSETRKTYLKKKC